MKKNISINISGIIFHIEEDGYEMLRKYLDSINRYFSSFEDSSEILADIESRIAEILLSKLNEGKQVITSEDIHTLIATMGSVNDFKAAEENEFAEGPTKTEEKKQSGQSGPSISSKKLFRDEKRKILGGVCSGLAHYFNIDPVWVRLLFGLAILGTYGVLLVAYIIFWIVLPPSTSLEDESSAKKMFRNTENKVIGGVAAGVGSFFGIDAMVVRILFVLLAFAGGVGLLVYIIMWMALPEAKTITDKIQMQGEPVTLSNIESSVKKGLNEKEDADESILAKIVLFPFRLIAVVLNGLVKIFGPVFMLIVDIARIGIGVMFSLMGAMIMLCLFIGLGIVLGFIHAPLWGEFPNWHLNTPNFPFTALRHSFPSWTVVAAFFTGLVPAIMIALLGGSIIAKKIIFNSYIGWGLFVIFFVSMAYVGLTLPQIIYSFKEEGEFREEKFFELNGKMPLLKINETGMDDYDVTDLTLKGYDGKNVKLVMRFESQGVSRKQAAENAQMVTYEVVQQDSVLIFDSNVTFKPDAKFRAQRLNMDIYIPFNQPFAVDENLWRLIDNRYDYRYYSDREENPTWKMNEYGLLECVTCYENRKITDETVVTRDEFGLTGFNAIDLEGIFDVKIEIGDHHAVELIGPDSDRRRYRIYTDHETLVIDYDDDREYFWKRDNLNDHEIELIITMPSLEKLSARGAGKIRFRGFKEERTSVNLLGAVSATGQLNATNLTVNLTGASSLDLSGSGDYLDADITGASTLRAFGYEVKQAVVEAHGASNAKVFVTEQLEMEKGMASSISHKGDPRIIKED